MCCARFVGIIVIGLFSGSTLATLVNDLPKDLPFVRHECGDKTLCHIKPAHYPQEEIDRAVLKYLPHLHRMKRQAMQPAKPEIRGNCESETMNATVYTIRDRDKVPRYLVQSKWFSQDVPNVRCKNERSSCFSAFVIQGLVNYTKCKTNKVTTSLVVYNQHSKKLERVDSSIDISCDCMINEL